MCRWEYKKQFLRIRNSQRFVIDSTSGLRSEEVELEWSLNSFLQLVYFHILTLCFVGNSKIIRFNAMKYFFIINSIQSTRQEISKYLKKKVSNMIFLSIVTFRVLLHTIMDVKRKQIIPKIKDSEIGKNGVRL